MKLIKVAILLGIALLGGNFAYAQENDSKPVDEVIARVNAGVIMRTAFEAMQRDVLEDMKRQGLSGEELEKKFNELKSRILDELINTQLLAQRAKDLSINVDAQVNQELLRIMKENNCENQECLGQKLREAGYDIEEVKRILGERFSKQSVLTQEVYRRLYMGLTEKEKREFYEKNKQGFSEPVEVTLSSIFIASGKDPDEALSRAKALVVQARSGAVEFKTLAQKNTESEAGRKEPSLGTFKINDLNPEVKSVVENAKVGDVTDPIKIESGYSIFRVDQRKEAKLAPFEDERVQQFIGGALAEQNADKEIEAYLTKLRNDAFIEIDPRYQFENSKVKSALIKRVPFIDEADKKKLKKEKEKEKKAAETPKATATNKP
ncbi:MAG TPA: peptidyl-prolyl cis-trans isomerase [Blastocatellia bacterium]|nr:peptidyl-prolyl cis-trans isomerase [Blastocatellia bacterium]